MKPGRIFSGLTLLLAFPLALIGIVPQPAAARQNMASAERAEKAAPPAAAAPASPTPLSAEEAAKVAMPSNPAPSPKTPLATDGHPDLTGLWWAYRGANLDVKQVGNTRVNLQPTTRAPESEDPENNLSVNTRIYDSVAARRADPTSPPTNRR